LAVPRPNARETSELLEGRAGLVDEIVEPLDKAVDDQPAADTLTVRRGMG
jgi:hypothetical protein